VPALLIFRRPDNRLGSMREIAARKIRRRIRLHPTNVVQQFKFKLLHGEADGVDHMAGPANPNRAVRLQNALASRQPGPIKFVIRIRPTRAIPLALVHADHLPRMAGNSIVRKKVRRVRKNQIHAIHRHSRKNIEAIALINPDVVLVIAKNGLRQRARNKLNTVNPIQIFSSFRQRSQRSQSHSRIGSLITKELKSSRANTQIAPASPFTLSSAKGRHPTTQNNVRSRIPDGRTTSQLAYRWRPCRLLRPQIPAKAAIKAGPTHVFSKPADFYIQGTIDPRLTMRYVRKAVRNPARGQLSKPAAVRANKLNVRRNLQVPGPQASGVAYSPKGNAAATRSRSPRSERKNSDALSAHGFLPRQKPRGSHATNAGNSKRLQPLTECFPISPKNSRAPEKSPPKKKIRHHDPSQFVAIKTDPDPLF